MSRPIAPLSSRILTVAALATAVALPSATAQENFGPNTQLLWVSAWEFEAITTANQLVRGAAEGNGAYLQGAGYFVAPLRLPAGAYIETLRCFMWDDGDASKARVEVLRTTFYIDTDAVEAYTGGGNWGVQVTGGGGFQEPSDGIGTTVNYRPDTNSSRDFALQAYIDTGDLLRGCEVLWHRTVSAAPGTATFDDVPTDHPFFQTIEALKAAGITVGCDPNNYCPDAPVTRAQMAYFLSWALGLYRQY